MKTKTSELTGPALDWAVAKCEGIPVTLWCKRLWLNAVEQYGHFVDGKESMAFEPSTSWAQGGPIIEREKIRIEPWNSGEIAWAATAYDGIAFDQDGDMVEKRTWAPTPLIAAMRCYVASKLGDEIDIPEELMK